MSEITINPAKTCCFTGHRPPVFPDHKGESYWKLSGYLEKELRSLIHERGYDTFIVGMAPGFDCMAGMMATVMKQDFPPFRPHGENIHVICALPYDGFLLKKNCVYAEEQRYIMERADEVVYVCPKPHRGSYQLRNRWMIDHSSRLIAYFSGISGGTQNTIRYAEKKNLPITNLFGVCK